MTRCTVAIIVDGTGPRLLTVEASDKETAVTAAVQQVAPAAVRRAAGNVRLEVLYVQAATEPEPAAPALDWYTSGSADDKNHDQEVDLDRIGSPGGASWASVAPDGQPQFGPWHWVIYNRWIDADKGPDPVLAEAPADTEDEAKAAVAGWVRAAFKAGSPGTRLEAIRASLRAQSISYGELAELQSLIPYITPGDTELLEAAGVPEFPGQEAESHDQRQ